MRGMDPRTELVPVFDVDRKPGYRKALKVMGPNPKLGLDLEVDWDAHFPKNPYPEYLGGGPDGWCGCLFPVDVPAGCRSGLREWTMEGSYETVGYLVRDVRDGKSVAGF